MAAHTRRTEKITLHFDLSYGDIETEEQILHAGTRKYSLQRHTPETLAEHRAKNSALALIPDDQIHRITHFVAEAELSSEATQLIFTTAGTSTPGNLAKMTSMQVHIPVQAMTAHRASKREAIKTQGHQKLSLYGVEGELSADQHTSVAADADALVTPLDVAYSIVYYHPQVNSTNATTGAIVMNDHVANAAGIVQFSSIISSQGPTGWSSVVNATDKNGNTLSFGNYYGNGYGGTTVQQYSLSPKTVQNMDTPLKSVLQTASNDMALMSTSWSVSQGVTNINHSSPTPAPALAMSRHAKFVSAGTDGYQYMVVEQTPDHGLDVYPGSINFDSDTNAFSIDVKNTYLRTLGAYYQLYDESGNPINVPPTPVDDGDIVTAVNTILGIPMPTDPTTLSFDWTNDATAVRLYLGGLGTSRWDNDVVWPGVILTGVFQYGIPILFLAAGAAIEDTSWYKSFIKDKETRELIFSVAYGIVGTEASGIAIPNVTTILTAMADAIAGILVHEGLEALEEWVVEKLTEAELEESIPLVGVIFQVANRLVDLAEMAETTVEVLTSPATIEVDVQRSLPLTVTVSPDPKHTVWPETSDYYQILVQYQGGTFFTAKGLMPTTTSSAPIVANFPSLPAGGQIQVIASIFSDTDWVAGQYVSPWTPAILTGGQTQLSISGDITENLVPLDATTQYTYKEKLTYNAEAGGHMWQPFDFNLDLSLQGDLNSGVVTAAISAAFQADAVTLSDSAILTVQTPNVQWLITDGANNYQISETYNTQIGSDVITVFTGNQPTALVNSLNCSDIGDNLCKLVGVTLNDKAQMLGYTWQAAGQNLTPCGTSGPDSSQIYAFQNISILQNPDAALKFPSCGFGNQPGLAYDQFGPVNNKDASLGNNFYLDPNGTGIGAYYLRQVVLDDTTPFDMNQTVCYGIFSQPHLDAVVVHPSGYVVGVSWMNSKMEIIQILDPPLPDNQVDPALLVSGLGSRQGLLYGPAAITITPDGRILILETVNARVQSFDVKGNPVPSFDGPFVLNLSTTDGASLDQGIASAAIRQEFSSAGAPLTSTWYITDGQNVYTIQPDSDGVNLDILQEGKQLFTVPLSYEADIANGTISAQWQQAFETNGITLSTAAILSAVATVTVSAQGTQWLIWDGGTAQSYKVTLDSVNSVLPVVQYVSTFPLYNPNSTQTITYLDMAAEIKGFIYVLSYTGDGSAQNDYVLDIYNPSGAWLSRTPDTAINPDATGVNAAKIAVDLWRNLFSLNFEIFQGPGGRTEPSVSEWVPSTPIG